MEAELGMQVPEMAKQPAAKLMPFAPVVVPLPKRRFSTEKLVVVPLVPVALVKVRVPMVLRVDAKSLAIGDDIGDEQAPVPSLAESSALLFFRRKPLEGSSHREKITPQGVSTVIIAPRFDDWRDSPILHRNFIEHLNQIRTSHE